MGPLQQAQCTPTNSVYSQVILGPSAIGPEGGSFFIFLLGIWLLNCWQVSPFSVGCIVMNTIVMTSRGEFQWVSLFSLSLLFRMLNSVLVAERKRFEF